MIRDIYIYKIGVNGYTLSDAKKDYEIDELKRIVAELFDVSMFSIHEYSISYLTTGSGYVFGEEAALILIGGNPNNVLDKAMKYVIKKYFDVSIFIATNIDHLEMNRDIIDQCDYLLHQSPICLGYKDRKHEMYSWIPEIYYNPDEEVLVSEKYRNEGILFAGDLNGIEDEIKEYKINNYPMIIFPSVDEDRNNTRLYYSEYKKILPLFRKVYITVREEARNIGWVTARYVEAISCNVYPYMNHDYDKFQHFGGTKRAEYARYIDMKKCKDFLRENRNNFKKLIEDIVTGDI